MNLEPPITILVVDDHPAFRLGIVSMIDDAPDMHVIAEAEDGHAAIELYGKYRPDVALIDLRLPGIGGVETIIAIRQRYSDCKIIVITTYDTDEDIFRALQSGAKSYLLKDTTLQELQKTIRAVYSGEVQIPSHVAQRLASRLTRPELTPREIDILDALVRGLSNKEIAREFSISETTVKGHLKSLFAKLGVADRTQAAVAALQHGIVHMW